MLRAVFLAEVGVTIHGLSLDMLLPSRTAGCRVLVRRLDLCGRTANMFPCSQVMFDLVVRTVTKCVQLNNVTWSSNPRAPIADLFSAIMSDKYEE